MMETKIKKIGFPIAVALIAVAGAFAGNLSSNDNSSLADKVGYRLVGTVCTATSVTCSDIESPIMCTDINSNQLYDLNGTSCPTELYHKF
jgi:hypothetical protein